MSGPIIGSAPWGRSAVAGMDPADRAALEALIPDGHFIGIGARNSPTDLSIRLMRGVPGDAVEVVAVYGQRRATYGCQSVLRMARSEAA